MSPPEVLLCDADGNLFPSEEPAFVASAEVTNDFLATLGVSAAYQAEELRLATTGKNFRTTAVDLCVLHGVPLSPSVALQRGLPVEPSGAPERGSPARAVLTPEVLDHWVEVEKGVVTAHLAQALQPDDSVLRAVGTLAESMRLAVVSSSASQRLVACLRATALEPFFAPASIFSAEDSLPVPVSKPDPAVYTYAGKQMRCAGAQGLAVEDSVAGAESAVAAGFPTVANLQFVPTAERAERSAAMRAAGVVAVVGSWAELADLLTARAHLGARGRPGTARTTAAEPADQPQGVTT